ncbi:MAG: hypothetical protein QNI84_13220 [Henriciella sp.]|nr:hypothetical protein [Henriciella sp.]
MGERIRICGRTGVKPQEATECASCGKIIRTIDWALWDEPGYEYGDCEPWCMTCTLSWQRAMVETDWKAEARRADFQYNADLFCKTADFALFYAGLNVRPRQSLPDHSERLRPTPKGNAG